MLKEEKCVEYYFDSKKFNEGDIFNQIKKEEKGFEKEKSDISIFLNEYGIYVVKVKFIRNKIVLPKIKFKQKGNKKQKIKKTYNGYETYSGEGKIYGKYKESTKTYQPI